jgi:hypothetical protein
VMGKALSGEGGSSRVVGGGLVMERVRFFWTICDWGSSFECEI